MKKSDIFETTYYQEDLAVDQIKVMFDGSCGPINPRGNMGYGFAIFNAVSGDLLAEGWGYELYDGKNNTSNNVSEWTSVNLALKLLRKSGYKYRKLFICGDSMLVVQQLKGAWSIKKGAYVPIATETLKDFKSQLSKATIYHIKRDLNDFCDELSNRYIDYLSTFGIDVGGRFKLKNNFANNEKSTKSN